MNTAGSDWESEIERINGGGLIQPVDPDYLKNIWKRWEELKSSPMPDLGKGRDAAFERALGEVRDRTNSGAEYFALAIRALMSKIAIGSQEPDHYLALVATIPMTGIDLSNPEQLLQRLEQLAGRE